MTSYVTETKDRLFTILDSEASIARVTSQSVRGETGDYPFAVISTGAAEYIHLANDTQQVNRDFVITIFAKPLAQGIELEAEEATDPFFESIPQLFNARPSLTTINSNDPLPSVQNAYLTSDNGFDSLEISGQVWATAAFVLRVEYLYDFQQQQ